MSRILNLKIGHSDGWSYTCCCLARPKSPRRRGIWHALTRLASRHRLAAPHPGRYNCCNTHRACRHLLHTDVPIEYVVDGEDIGSVELADPRWSHTPLKESSYLAAEPATAIKATNLPSPCLRLPTKRGRRPTKRRPPPAPFLDRDLKTILQPHGGLALAAVSVAALSDTIQSEARITLNGEYKVGIRPTSNLVVVRTPSESRARLQEKLTELRFNHKPYYPCCYRGRHNDRSYIHNPARRFSRANSRQYLSL